MADLSSFTAWDTIMDYVEESFQLVTKDNNFFHDVGENVGFWKPSWEGNWAEVNIIDGRGRQVDHKRTDVIYEDREVEIKIADTVPLQPSGRDLSRKLERMKSDVFGAMFRGNVKQGGNAIDTTYVDHEPTLLVEKEALFELSVLFVIRYRFVYTALNQTT